MGTQVNTTGITNIYNLILLDESGSMGSIYEQALGGANETIQTIRAAQASADDQKQFLTFVTFDSGDRESVRTVIDTKPIEHVKDLTRDDYRPNGCTPLYDAMGRSLTALEQKVTDDDQVLVTIITDGMENSSREYSGASVCEIVKRLRAKGWTFVYIGANQDAVEVAKRMSIDNAMNFHATHEDTRRMWKDYRESTSGYYEKVRMAKMRGERIFEDKEFFVKDQQSQRVTPDRITNLNSGEIFVFGSNLQGRHGGGAAAAAHMRFGAIWGCGVGIQGQSYAIPTMHGGVKEIKPFVDEFILYAKEHPELTFLVTRIGCGIAGFRDEEIAPLFKECTESENIILPKSFHEVLENMGKKSDNREEYDLSRFHEAQAMHYQIALAEIKDGYKRSHWMWYIFPQIKGLGKSSTSQYYGITSLDETKAYLDDERLGARLREICAELLKHSDRSVQGILGGIDSMKLKSSMTLFDAVSPDDVFAKVLDVFFFGKRDKLTLEIINR